VRSGLDGLGQGGCSGHESGGGKAEQAGAKAPL
jgi:hypothetical protein